MALLGEGKVSVEFEGIPQVPFLPERPVALLADVHSNLEALQVADQWLREEGIDQVLLLGDLVGYGASPTEVVSLVRSRGWPSVLGNHDLWAASPEEMDVPFRRIKQYARETLEWTYQQLDQEARDYLLSFPRILRLGSMGLAVHGSLADPDHCFAYIYDLSLHLNIQSLASLGAPKGVSVFYGHTHKPAAFAITGDSWRDALPASGSLELEDEACFLNPGSIGYPRDGDPRLSFAVWYPAPRKLRWVRLPYALDLATAKMKAAALPEASIHRLRNAH